MPGIFNPDPIYFDAGTKMWFYQDVAPAGWTIDAVPADALLAVKGGANAYNVAGGNQAGTWTQPDHVHSGPNHRHSVDPPLTDTTQGNTQNPITAAGGDATRALNHIHRVDIPAFNSDYGGTGNTGSKATAATYRPLAQVGVICTKD